MVLAEKGPNELGLTLGRRIREARREAGLTQMALAEKVGLRLWHIERFESGGAVPVGELEKIAAAVGRPVSWFARDEQETAGSSGGGEKIRLLFEARMEARRAARESERTREQVEPDLALLSADFRRRWYELVQQRGERSGWRRRLKLEGSRLEEDALSLLTRAAELDAEWPRRVAELEAELAVIRERERRLSDALSSALNTGEALREEARKESERVLRKVRRRAERIVARAVRMTEREEREHARREAEVTRLRQVVEETRAELEWVARVTLARLERAAAPGRRDAPREAGELVEDLRVAADAAEPAARPRR